MPRNVEIKARLQNFDKVVHIAVDLCNSDEILLIQEDIFFKVPYGRLKLRNFQDGRTSQLISYNRPDSEGPKISDYRICKIENNIDCAEVLKSALGILGVVKKERHLFLYQQTRIHIDKVENLGEFLELEVVLSEDQNLEDGEKIVTKLLEKFEIEPTNLVTGAYIDLLKVVKS